MSDVKPGDIVDYRGEERVVVDIAVDPDDGYESAVLRRTDDDPERKLDDDGGDADIWATDASTLTAIGHIA